MSWYKEGHSNAGPPMTAAQKEYIDALCERAEVDLDDALTTLFGEDVEADQLTVDQASQVIDYLKEQCEAFELYPAESRLLDPSNYYTLWCFPGLKRIKVGMDEPRRVFDADEAFAPQRGLAE